MGGLKCDILESKFAVTVANAGNKVNYCRFIVLSIMFPQPSVREAYFLCLQIFSGWAKFGLILLK